MSPAPAENTEMKKVMNKEGEREKASSPLHPLLGKEKGEENTDIDIGYPMPISAEIHSGMNAGYRRPSLARRGSPLLARTEKISFFFQAQ